MPSQNDCHCLRHGRVPQGCRQQPHELLMFDFLGIFHAVVVLAVCHRSAHTSPAAHDSLLRYGYSLARSLRLSARHVQHSGHRPEAEHAPPAPHPGASAFIPSDLCSSAFPLLRAPPTPPPDRHTGSPASAPPPLPEPHRQIPERIRPVARPVVQRPFAIWRRGSRARTISRRRFATTTKRPTTSAELPDQGMTAKLWAIPALK